MNLTMNLTETFCIYHFAGLLDALQVLGSSIASCNTSPMAMPPIHIPCIHQINISFRGQRGQGNANDGWGTQQKTMQKQRNMADGTHNANGKSFGFQLAVCGTLWSVRLVETCVMARAPEIGILTGHEHEPTLCQG